MGMKFKVQGSFLYYCVHSHWTRAWFHSCNFWKTLLYGNWICTHEKKWLDFTKNIFYSIKTGSSHLFCVHINCVVGNIKMLWLFINLRLMVGIYIVNTGWERERFWGIRAWACYIYSVPSHLFHVHENYLEVHSFTVETSNESLYICETVLFLHTFNYYKQKNPLK